MKWNHDLYLKTEKTDLFIEQEIDESEKQHLQIYLKMLKTEETSIMSCTGLPQNICRQSGSRSDCRCRICWILASQNPEYSTVF